MSNSNGSNQSAQSKRVNEFRQEMEFFRKCSHLREIGYPLEEAIALLSPTENELELLKQAFTGSGGERANFPDLKVGKDGIYRPVPQSPENLAYLLQSVLGYRPKLNLLKNRVFSNGLPISDLDLSKTINAAKRHGLLSAKDHINAVIDELADKHSFHPFKDIVESKVWDGRDHIADLFSTLTINPDFHEHSDIYFQYLKRWLVGVIAKVYKPGSQNGVLTLQGDQGKGKSMWLQKCGLAPDSYGEGGLNPDSKDDQLKHLDFVVWHASELDGIVRKRDVAALKDFFTRTDISVRPAYGRYDRTGKSNCSFCASVNDTQFLNDVTGSRRYLIIPIEAINYNHAIDMQQVYAQALSLFRAGEKWWFEGVEINAINAANEKFNLETPIDDLASRIQPGEIELTGPEIFERSGWDKPSHSELTKLGVLLRKKRIESARIKRNGTHVTIYRVKQIPRP